MFFYGGAKGGGKSFFVRAREIIRRMTNPGTTGLIIRKTHPELLANHIRKFWKEYPETIKWYNKQEKAIYYPNGSITEFSYLRSLQDVYNYQGREYEDISIDEVTQHEYEVVRILAGSNRTSQKNLNISPTMVLTGNPGGIGHQEIKRLFIDRNYRDNENPEDYGFTQALVYDNDALMDADPGYINRLKNQPDHLVKAYLEGDWNIYAGLALSHLTRSTHMVEPHSEHKQDKYFAGYDFGYNHPFAFVLCRVDQDKNVYIVSEISESKKTIEEQAEMINSLLDGKSITIFAGHDAWAKRGGPSIIQQLRNLVPNCTWNKAYIDRVQGISRIRELTTPDKNGHIRLKWFKNCDRSFETCAGMMYDNKKPEDVLKVDANEYGVGGDDLYDALRYAVTTYFKPKMIENEEIKKNTGAELLKIIEERAYYRHMYDD